jgi:hypothetical protein
MITDSMKDIMKDIKEQLYIFGCAKTPKGYIRTNENMARIYKFMTYVDTEEDLVKDTDFNTHKYYLHSDGISIKGFDTLDSVINEVIGGNNVEANKK